jgi:RNA polymerase sigma factor (sigma-70 family)
MYKANSGPEIDPGRSNGVVCLFEQAVDLPLPDPHHRNGLHPELASGGSGHLQEPMVARAREGDEEACRLLADRLSPLILKLVRSNLPRRVSEEDLVQEVFLRVFSKLDQYAGLVPLEHWVSRIAVNTCINALKHESVRPELRLADLSEEEEAVVQRRAVSGEDLPGDRRGAAQELVATMLARLNPDDRWVITLLHLDERSTKEISRTTGWSVAQVKVRAFRARHKMRALWKTWLKGQRI